ncbi:MAG: hypothetical protein HC941_11140 [Microcoleus sp. SU_5_3]|nr:hypothetical protein [Microcoleus sp. SU_5_3]
MTDSWGLGEAFGRQSLTQNQKFHIQMLRPGLTREVRSQQSFLSKRNIR